MASGMKSTFILMMVAMLALASSAVATSSKDCPPTPSIPKRGSPATKPGSGTGRTGGPGGAPRTCPIDIVRLNVCSPLLGGAPAPNCCPLLGLLGVNLEVCLCLAVDLNVLNLVHVNIPKLDIVAKVATSCGVTLPPNFTCPS